MPSQKPLLAIEGLEVRVPGPGYDIVVLDGVDLVVQKGQMYGLIGETGAGKSMTAAAAIDLVPPPAWISHGRVRFKDRTITGASLDELRQLRGNEMSLIVQNARAALNPVMPIDRQIENVYRAHHPGVGRAEAQERAIAMLRSVGIPATRASAYQHELSGGMAQRVLIAMALINDPTLLIADEPTTGLDVTIQAEVLDLLVGLIRDKDSAVLLITHDLALIANYAEEAAVMFAGGIIESGPVADILENPRHPYTRGLVAAAEDAAQRHWALDVAGPPPDLAYRPPGCQFAYRCPWVEEVCRTAPPQLVELRRGHEVRCFVAERKARAEGAERPTGSARSDRER